MILKNENGNCSCIIDSTVGWNIVYTPDDVHPNIYVMSVSFSSIVESEALREHQGTSAAIVRFSLKLILYDTFTKTGVAADD